MLQEAKRLKAEDKLDFRRSGNKRFPAHSQSSWRKTKPSSSSSSSYRGSTLRLRIEAGQPASSSYSKTQPPRFARPPGRTRASDTADIIIPNSPTPVGGCLKLYSLRWSHITTDIWVLQTVLSGYLLEFTSKPSSYPPFRVTPIPRNPNHKAALEKEILSLLEKNAIIPLPSGTAVSFTSTLFLAPKKNGEWRPIINL